MKKLLFLGLLFLTAKSYAFNPKDWDYIPGSSYTEAGSGLQLLSSGTIQMIGVTISSPGANSYVSFFRSTSASPTPDMSTQALISTDYNNPQMPTFIPLFEAQNDSYTYVNKVGNAKLTYWLRCLDRAGRTPYPCPILNTTGAQK